MNCFAPGFDKEEMKFNWKDDKWAVLALATYLGLCLAIVIEVSALGSWLCNQSQGCVEAGVSLYGFMTQELSIGIYSITYVDLFFAILQITAMLAIVACAIMILQC